MSGMEVVPVILCLLFPGVAANWFADQSRQATKKEAPPSSAGVEIVLSTTARSPRSDAVSQQTPPTSTTSAVFHLSLEDADDPRRATSQTESLRE
jgi:hypothetical protein